MLISGNMMDGFGSYRASVPRAQILSVSSDDGWLKKLRASFLAGLKSSLSDPELSLAASYLFGRSDMLPDSLSEAIRNVGLSHIVAVSGFHLGLVLTFSRKVFGKLSRFATLWSGVLLSLLFGALTGFGASMSRATVASLFSLVTWYFGRKLHPVRAICYTATIMLAIKPSWFLDLGWQFSFLAYAGIVIFAPVVTRYFYGDAKPNLLAASIIQSISAQLLCLPITLYNFGKVALLGIFLNLIISPILGSTMLFSALAAIPRIGQFFAPLSYYLLHVQIWLIERAARISWGLALFEPGRSEYFVIYAFVVLLFVIIHFRSRPP